MNNLTSSAIDSLQLGGDAYSQTGSSANIPTVSIRNLCIGYPAKRGVHTVASGICATIHSGELTCLLGANGVGKSTLLRTLSAFQPKLSGEIYLRGREIATYTDRQLSRLISVVLTERCDIRGMSVIDLVGMGRSPYTGFWGTLSRDDRVVVDRSIDLVGISHLAHRMIHTLSDGERQKVMIAKALAQKTPIIYLDEPTAFLDYPSKVEMMQLLHRICRQTDKTVFLSTHDLELALQIADVVWLMDKAKGVTVGTPEDLSLDGSLGSFFGRRGVAFDMETGLFRVDSTFTHSVYLSGSGPHYAMARKALQRVGIRAVCGDAMVNEGSNAPAVRIEIDATHPSARPYLVICPQQAPQRVSTIADLLAVVHQALA